MPWIFSYGTLQRDDVQRATYGRLLRGRDDALVGFALTSVRIEDPQRASKLGRTHHANAAFDGRDGSRVQGMVFEVSDAELAATDRYEREDGYERIAVTLASGLAAWVYVHARSRTDRGLPTKDENGSSQG